MKKSYSAEEFRFFNKHGRFPDEVKPKKKPLKYKNKPKYVDGIFFQSSWEAECFGKVKLMKKAGEILDFTRQTPIPLEETDYLADFVLIHKNGTVEVVDAKGIETGVFKIKWKQCIKTYPGIKFTMWKK